MSLLQLTQWCETQVGPNLVEKSPEERPFDIPWMVLDPRQCQQTWDWQIQTPIASILQEIATFADQQPNWLTTSNPKPSAFSG